jgi:hypothetical protein
VASGNVALFLPRLRADGGFFFVLLLSRFYAFKRKAEFGGAVAIHPSCLHWCVVFVVQCDSKRCCIIYSSILAVENL